VRTDLMGILRLAGLSGAGSPIVMTLGQYWPEESTQALRQAAAFNLAAEQQG